MQAKQIGRVCKAFSPKKTIYVDMPENTRIPNKKTLALMSAGILFIIVTSSFLFLAHFTDAPAKQEFYFGVEVAYGNIDDLKAVVDKTRSYTNLIVFGLPEFTKNLTSLNAGCDYIYSSGMHFIVLLTNTSHYIENGWENTTPAQWAVDAKARYGDKFLAVYRWDEPGGDQIDNSKYREVENATDFTDAANQYVNVLKEPVQYYRDKGIPVVTADYVLHWFDYKVGYDAILAEFGWNNSREQQIALVRGAARAYDKEWGVVVTWEYNQEPYIENGTQLFEDLMLAYDNGARYAVVFSYPEIEGAECGILQREHLNALKDFSEYIAQDAPAKTDYQNITAYVLPADYGFGFRRALDSIWGLWPSNNITQRIYSDVENLIAQQGTDFDIVCDYPTLLSDAKGRYGTLVFWNGTTINP